MLEIGNHRQLFLDDYIIAETHGLTRTLHQPEKAPNNPLLAGEHPWEDVRLMYPIIFQDGKIFRMYFLSFTTLKEEKLGLNIVPVGYAESEDGLEWHKPMMKNCPVPGHPETNLAFVLDSLPLVRVEGPAVLCDNNEKDPMHRYKMFFSKGRDRVSPGEGFCVAFSSDGLVWQEYEGNPVYHLYGDTQNCVVWDSEIERWVAYVRLWGLPDFERPVWYYKKYDETRIRLVGRMTSADFLHWTKPEVVLTPDPSDSPMSDFYGLQATWYEGQHVAFLWMFEHQESDNTGSTGYLNSQMVTSRDHGLHWHRVADRATFLDRGPEGSFDAGGVYPVPFLTVGERHYIYYTASNGEHSANTDWCIALATIRRDGFVSLDAKSQSGELITHPFPVSGRTLHINAEILSEGRIEVSLEDSAGNVLPGFEKSNSIEEGGLDVPVRFARETFESVEKARMRFRLQNAKLYSFWLAP